MRDIAPDEEDWEPDPQVESFVHVKWVADGAKTLSEMAERLRDYALELLDLEAHGWQLTGPVDNSHGEIERSREDAERWPEVMDEVEATT